MSLNQLKGSNWFSELFTFSGVIQSAFVSTSCTTCCHPSNTGSCHLEDFCSVFETIGVLHFLRICDETIFHCNQSVLNNSECHFPFDFFNRKTFRSFFDNETFDLIVI